MFSRQDLLSRHSRLSQCSGAVSSNHVNPAQHNPATSRYPPSARQATSPDNVAAPSPLSSSRRGPTPSFSFDEYPHASFVVEGTSYKFTTPTCAAHESDQGPAGAATPGFATNSHSQEHFMGKFSIHDYVMETQDDSSGDSPGSVTYRGQHQANIATHATPDFLQLQTFDTGLFPNESDLINDYLIAAFPPSDYRSPSLENGTDRCGVAFDERLEQVATPSIPSREPATMRQPTASSTQGQLPAAQSLAVDDDFATEEMEREPGGIGASMAAIDDIVATNPFTVSASAYDRLSAEVLHHRHALPEAFTLPGRQTLSRYITAYIRGFHPHLPFIHLPTTGLDSMEPMLLLTLATVGSFYGFEHPDGYAMHFIAKSIITSRLEKRRLPSTLALLKSFPSYAELPSNSSRNARGAPQPHKTFSSTDSNAFDIELLQALLMLVLTMSWLDGPLAEDALAMSSQLTALTREALRSRNPDASTTSWVDWSREEELRRTLFSAYFVLNVQTICFDVPPQITVSEMDVPLPCSGAQFKAPTASAWQRLYHQTNAEHFKFNQCMVGLLSGKPIPKQVSISEYGNYMLIQGLIMQIYVEHQSASVLLSSQRGLTANTIKLYDTALGAWQACWDSAAESALDPSSPHGPLAFNSTAMLRLAHIHLGAGLYSQCALRSRDPKFVAQAFEPSTNTISLRSPHLEQAVLHAIYGLRIPVRVGIAFVARGRTGHWSVQHAISNFACALLLTHWLENLFSLVSSGGIEVLRPGERRLLSMIERLIDETHLRRSLGPEGCYPNRIRRLAIAAVKVWAETCKGIQVYELVHIIGETLSLVAEALESRLQE